MKTVAGIDMGTQSMKVVLYDYENKKTVESSSCPIDLISENDGTREQKTEWYKNAMEVCFSKLSKEGKATIQALGVSGHQHGFVPLDKEGNALYNVKLWNDTSTVEECKIITDVEMKTQSRKFRTTFFLVLLLQRFSGSSATNQNFLQSSTTSCFHMITSTMSLQVNT